MVFFLSKEEIVTLQGLGVTESLYPPGPRRGWGNYYLPSLKIIIVPEEEP